VPVYLPYSVLIAATGIIATILIGLNRALAGAGWPAQERIRTVGTMAVILGVWFASAIALSLMGAFQTGPDAVPTLQYGIVLPILIGGLLIWRSRQVARIIDAVPQSWLVGVQLYRAVGVMFLILYASGKLPALFAWPAGIGDILVGVLAPVVAFAYARDPAKNGDLVAAWNWFGIGDLAIAVATGFISAPSLLQPFTVEPPNQLISLFPLVLIPIFLVPLSILLHIASLTKLRRAAAAIR
jgi:hypothetical protein